MWKNFFHVALRNISKNRVFSFINIAGLAIGLASSILIILFIAKEISFDRFHEKSDRIYRMYMDGSIGGQDFKGAWTSYVAAPVFAREIDEIEAFTRVEVFPQQVVWNNKVRRVEDNVLFVDSSFFDLFSIELLYGNPETVLDEPNSIVITRAKAIQYFGTENPLGMTLEFNNANNYYVVTGVMEEFPDNSHIYCDFLAPMSNVFESRSEDWFSISIYSYLLIKPGVDYTKVEQKMNQVMLKHIRPQLDAILGVTPEEWINGGNAFGVFLQPLTHIHLNPEIETGSETCLRPVNDKIYIYIFALIAFFILLIASINFMNLSTARSAIRAREIAMRKVVGSQRTLLIYQFLVESVLLSLLALILAIFLVEISLPAFNRAMGISLDFHALGKGMIFTGVLLLTLMVGLISGFYPSFYISRYKPLDGLRGGQLRGKGSAMFRSVMVIVQFTISVGIIVGTLVVTRQVSYLIHKNPGFEDENIVVIDRVYALEDKIGVFCQEAEKIPGVSSVTNSSTYLGFSNLTVSYQVKGADRARNFMFDVNFVEPDFLDTYGLQLSGKAGRFLSEKIPGDTLSVVLNEAAVREYGFADPLNTVIQNISSDGQVIDYKVIGVIKDFHHSSFRKTISPYMFLYKTNYNAESGYVSIRFEKSNMMNGTVLKKVHELWNNITGDEPFQYFYLDEELDTYYREEERTGKISMLFAILAIIIASLGLLGLTIFNTERRFREIAIRKAMGARVADILMIISREILILLGISIVIAWVLAFIFMKNWLQVFPYNIGFTPGIYLLSALVAILIAMLTVNSIAWRASRKNPVDALYHE